MAQKLSLSARTVHQATTGVLRSRTCVDGRVLFVDEAGRFFRAEPQFQQRWDFHELTAEDSAFLNGRGLSDDHNGLARLASLFGRARREAAPAELDYLILIPTLRCNLSCSYCQVSRAIEGSAGYDWSDETLSSVIGLVQEISAPFLKIEFQGGEPTLRCDLIERVIEACSHLDRAEFVICTNLSNLGPDVLALFDRPNVFISTSLDGPLATHRAARTVTSEATDAFAANLKFVLERYGPEKLSALPTIDPQKPPHVDELIDAFASRGLRQIFLRPINFQGFARKRHGHVHALDGSWHDYYERFVRALIAYNWEHPDAWLEETYLSLCLRRIFSPGHDRHVDLRNPNPVGVDFIVVDYDGNVYPTDEARMLTRSGVIDLRIGHVDTGWDTEARRLLSAQSDNRYDLICSACAYQPFCGRDVVDDISRYGTIALPRNETEFCRRHMRLFDLAFDLIYNPDPAVQWSLLRWLRVRGEDLQLGASR